MADKVRKGRQARVRLRGERNPAAKLSASAVCEIRLLRAAGASATSLAKRFGVARSTVSMICTGRKWLSQ